MKPSRDNESRWFGYREVNPQEKTGLVGKVFDSVAPNYDVMNDLMSGGVHRLWKSKLARMIGPRPGDKILDVAGGTGDIAFRLLEKTGGEAKVTVCDINPNMLQAGQDRATDKGWHGKINWVTGNAETLPFPDMSFDICTIAFGLRNVTRIDQALSEMHRILKPGGRFFCLEFSHVKDPALSKVYDIWSFGVIPNIGRFVAKDRESYQYLVESIRKFPDQENLKDRMEAAGFEKTSYRNLTGGVVAIHSGWRF